jgi:rhamnosyltransferase
MSQVSIIIRTKNEERLLRKCLEGVFLQETTHVFEVLMIDSGSTDGTLEIARQFPQVRIHEIAPEEFNYGRTLNLGVQLTKGDYVVVLSADCVPENKQWLNELIDPLLHDATLAATFARQIPWPRCRLYERHRIEQQFPTEPNVKRSADRGPSKFSIVFSNACSCIRRSCVEETPFEPVKSAEDRVWATAMIDRGFGIAYTPLAVVRHSHSWSLAFVYNKGFKVGESVKLVGESAWYVDIRRWLRWWFLLATWREWYGRAKTMETNFVRRATVSARAMTTQFMFEAGIWRSHRLVSPSSLPEQRISPVQAPKPRDNA